MDNNLDHAEELSARLCLAEILWNFSRYEDRARITLEQNPHFYLRCPADENVYSPTFQRYPLQDLRGALEDDDTVYVLFDRPGSVFLTNEHNSVIFGNIWSLNDSLIFRGLCGVFRSPRLLSDVSTDRSGVLEGDQLVRSSSMRYNLWHCGGPVVHQDFESCSRLNHRRLQPIVTAPRAFEDWTVLSHPASHYVYIHIHCSQAPTSHPVCFNASIYSDTADELLYRTWLHRHQHPLDQGTSFYTRLSIRLTMIHSSAYSITIGWITGMLGMTNLGGASSLMFVKDGVTSYTNQQSIWVCRSYARKAPP